MSKFKINDKIELCLFKSDVQIPRYSRTALTLRKTEHWVLEAQIIKLASPEKNEFINNRTKLQNCQSNQWYAVCYNDEAAELYEDFYEWNVLHEFDETLDHAITWLPEEELKLILFDIPS